MYNLTNWETESTGNFIIFYSVAKKIYTNIQGLLFFKNYIF